MANPHIEAGVLRAGAPLNGAEAVAVLVHGRGGGAEGMLQVAQHLQVPGGHWVALRAAGGTWYPQRFIAPLDQNEPFLSWALDALDAQMAALAGAGWPAERVAIIGFSQGACLVSEYVARNPRRYGAVAALTGGLIGPGPDLTEPATDLEATPILLTSTEHDPWVPAERTLRTAAVFEAAGAAVDLRIFTDPEHTIRSQELIRTRELVLAAAAGDRAGS